MKVLVAIPDDFPVSNRLSEGCIKGHGQKPVSAGVIFIMAVTEQIIGVAHRILFGAQYKMPNNV